MLLQAQIINFIMFTLPLLLCMLLLSLDISVERYDRKVA